MTTEDSLIPQADMPADTGVHAVANYAAADRGDRVAATIQRLAPFVVLAVMVTVGAFAFGGTFMNSGILRNIAEDKVSLALVAAGMTFVIISGGIDLSVGSVLAVGAVLTAWGSTHYGPVAAIVLPVVVCSSIGMVNGLLIAKAKMPPFIVTLAALLFGRGLALFVTNSGSTKVNVQSDSGVKQLGRGVVFGIPIQILIALAVFLVAAVVLNRTRSGQAVFALGGSEDAAVLMGLPVVRTKVLLYTASGFLAGLAGMIAATRTLSGDPNFGQGLELQAIAAVVIGGTLLTGGFGTMSGTLAGVLLLGVIGALIRQVGTLTENHQNLTLGAFLILVVILQKLLSKRQRA